MFQTYVGPVQSDETHRLSPPETAQAIFAQFKNVLETSRQKVPFGIAQVGKAFRNEVTPRNFTFRSREFEQMELEFFIKPDEVVEAITAGAWPPPKLGHPRRTAAGTGAGRRGTNTGSRSACVLRRHRPVRDTLGSTSKTPEELAHYARACVDILFKFPFSKKHDAGETGRHRRAQRF
jgi:glycyl-tRNA synthetase